MRRDQIEIIYSDNFGFPENCIISESKNTCGIEYCDGSEWIVL